MRIFKVIQSFLIVALLAAFLAPASGVWAAHPQASQAQSGGVSPFDLIIAINTLRVSYGLPALQEDPIVNAVAQATAEIMAANQMSWHIGDVRGRIAAAGYGGGATVWATENFAVGTLSIDEIMQVWADPTHMIPAVNPAYCHVGAGVAKAANGQTYYVLQAAYTSAKACGEYKPPSGSITQPGGSTDQGSQAGVSQLIVPVNIATPDADGQVYHVVQAGQSYWAIAIAYKITIKDLEVWNNLSREDKLQIGQRLFIPTSNTAGYATPTPVGMVLTSTPDQDGKIIHSVQPYQTLITIAQAYGTKVDTLLVLNGLQVDWPLQIGQKLLVHPGSVTPSPTPRPLTPLEKLTPASDGKYYHTVKSGETLSWIAGLYETSVAQLMAWNGLDSSAIYPEQKLVLQVTPPATETPTPGPPTATATATPIPPTATQTQRPTQASPSPTSTAEPAPASGGFNLVWLLSLGVAIGGVGLVIYHYRRSGKHPL